MLGTLNITPDEKKPTAHLEFKSEYKDLESKVSAYMDAGDYSKALELLQTTQDTRFESVKKQATECIERKKKAEDLEVKADAYFLKQEYKLSLSCYEQALELHHPNHKQNAQAGKKKAESEFKALELYNKACSLFDKREFQKALKEFSAAFRLTAERKLQESIDNLLKKTQFDDLISAEQTYHHAITLLKTNQVSLYIESLAEVLKLNPKHEPAQKALHEAQSQKALSDTAIALAEGAIESGIQLQQKKFNKDAMDRKQKNSLKNLIAKGVLDHLNTDTSFLKLLSSGGNTTRQKFVSYFAIELQDVFTRKKPFFRQGTIGIDSSAYKSYMLSKAIQAFKEASPDAEICLVTTVSQQQEGSEVKEPSAPLLSPSQKGTEFKESIGHGENPNLWLPQPTKNGSVAVASSQQAQVVVARQPSIVTLTSVSS